MTTPSCEAKVFFPGSRFVFFLGHACCRSSSSYLSGGVDCQQCVPLCPCLVLLQAYVMLTGRQFMRPSGNRPLSLEHGAQSSFCK